MEFIIEKYSGHALITIYIGYIVLRDFGVFKKATGGMNGAIRKINDLHDWHAKEDEMGVKVWYNRKDLERAVVKIVDIQEKIVDMSKDLSADQRQLKEATAKIQSDLDAIRGQLSSIS